MPSRAELEVMAAAVNVTAANYPNDSKLEQKVLYELKNMTAKAGTGTTQAPSVVSASRISGAQNT